MKLRQVTFALIIGCTPCIQLPALSQQRVKGSEGKSRHPPSIVKTGAPTPVKFDLPSESIYCSSEGKRIIPVRMAHIEGENLEGLRRPQRELLPLRESGGKSRKILVEYCEKTETTQEIHYKSAIVKHEETTMFADKFVFNHQTQNLAAAGRVDVVQHGERLGARPDLLVNLKDGQFRLDYTNGLIASVLGKGEIKSGSGKASFDFVIDMKKKEIQSIDKFVYEDQRTGLRLEARKRDCLFIKTTPEGVVTFGGSAELTGVRHRLRGHHKNVYFIVTVKDGRQSMNNDRFSISIPSLTYFQESAPITLGDIEVNGLAKGDAPRGTGVRFE